MARILFITTKPYYPWEGACHRTRHTLEALVTLGYPVDLLTPPTCHLPSQMGISVVPLRQGLLTRLLPKDSECCQFLRDLRLLCNTLCLVGKNPYDLIHGVDTGGIIAWLTARLTKIPYIFEQTTTCFEDDAKTSRHMLRTFYRTLTRKALSQADAVIGNSTDVLDIATPLGRRSRTCVIPDIPAIAEAVSTPTFNLAQARYRTSSNQKLVTCVGSYTQFQGLDLFFNALPRLLTNHPNTRIVVVGGSEREITRMRHALKDAGLDEVVCFPGRIPTSELAALLAISNVLVSARRAGTTPPIKVLDYLYSETPIVAIDTPANRSILSSDNAILTRPTPEDLADGIIKVLRTSPRRCLELAKHGRTTLKQAQRTPEAFCSAIERCYTYVLSTT